MANLIGTSANQVSLNGMLGDAAFMTASQMPVSVPQEQALAGKAPATALETKVDKAAGKQLSTEDYTTAEKAKLAGVAAGATANSANGVLLDRANHTGTQAISTITDLASTLSGKQAALVSGTNVKSVNGVSLLGSGNIDIAAPTEKKFYFHTANTTFTVPAGISVVRFYAGGRGGNGAAQSTAGAAGGGGGGGFAFGDLAVVPGNTVAVEIAAGQTLVKLNGVTVGTARPGVDGSTIPVDMVGNPAAGGTATITASVTNGGAYAGGAGGDARATSGSRAGTGGGSCGSPLGAGFPGGDVFNAATNASLGTGGGGIGGAGSGNGPANSAVGGGGAGEAGSTAYGGSCSATGAGRGMLDAFSDPLLKGAISARSSATSYPLPGAGGYTTAGGDFGGGGGGAGSALARDGGLMGGGGGFGAGTATRSAGNGGYGGGGGGCACSVPTGGAGGAAFCFLYY